MITIVALVMFVGVVSILTDHRQKIIKLKGEIVREEIELEKLKQQNYIIETEKMKLELEQMKLDFTSTDNLLPKE